LKIEILPTTTAEIPLAILSMTNLDNRELNPAIEKQLTTQQIPVAQPQSALADLIQVIHAHHPVAINAWDMNALGTDEVQLQVTAQGARLATTSALVSNLDSKSSRILVVIGDTTASAESVHATGQELQRKIKAFFGIQARLQFPSCTAEPVSLETTRPAS
jgi:Tfp pilus assembly PilM family ATPase